MKSMYALLLVLVVASLFGCATVPTNPNQSATASITRVADTTAPATPEQPSGNSKRFWSGFLVVNFNSNGNAVPEVAILFPHDVGDESVITTDVLQDATKLQGEKLGEGWRFAVTRGDLLYKAVRIDVSGRVMAEIHVHESGDNVILAKALPMDGANSAIGHLCGGGVCGTIFQAAADHAYGCEGPDCGRLIEPASR